MRRFLVFVVFAGAVAVAGLWYGKTFAPCSAPMAALAGYGLKPAATCPAVAAEAAERPRVVAPPAVTVVDAKTRPFVDRLFVSGTLVPREEATVGTRMDAVTIVELDAEDGDVVKAGQVLARLDRAQLDAMLAENDAATARADAAIAQARDTIAQSVVQVQFASDDFDRARKLGAGIMATSTVEQRETAFKTAQAQLAAAKSALSVAEADRKSRDAERMELRVRISRTEVKAPVSGVISRRAAKLGATVAFGGEPLFRIIEDGAIDLDAEAPEQYLSRLKIGMPAKLRLPGAAADVGGTVRLVSAEVDKASRTGKARIALADVSGARIGAFASGEVDLSRRDGIGAPATALRRDAEGARVLVVRDGRVEERRVTTGIVEGDWVELVDGVKDGESLVARAAAFLRPGDVVRPVAAPPAGAS
jgi:RND family efflux transporter MFP subunit